MLSNLTMGTRMYIPRTIGQFRNTQEGEKKENDTRIIVVRPNVYLHFQQHERERERFINQEYKRFINLTRVFHSFTKPHTHTLFITVNRVNKESF